MLRVRAIRSPSTLEEFSVVYAKIMVFGDGQFYRGFGGYWVFWFWGCGCSCHWQFGTVLALVE